MTVSYVGLWKLLLEKRLQKQDLVEQVGLSSATVAKCIKCGLCLEVCPNYAGEEGRFYGAVLANEAYLLYTSSENRKKEIAKEYRRHFASGCSKSLACRDVCPMNTTLSSIGYMNRTRV